MCLLFSVTMPIVAGLAALFFFFRFHIEKYNMIFVYQQDYESYGFINKTIIPYQLFSVILFQAMNFSFIDYLAASNNFNSYAGFFVVFQVIGVVILYFVIKRYPDSFLPEEEEDEQNLTQLELQSNFSATNRPSLEMQKIPSERAFRNSF